VTRAVDEKLGSVLGVTNVTMRRLCLALFAAVLGCTSAAPDRPPRGDVSPRVQPAAEPAPAVAWSAWSSSAFERAEREGKLVLLDVGIEGCTACRWMHEETYADPAVRRRLQRDFVAVAADADQQPDVGARFEPWGWPATVVLDPKGGVRLALRGSRPPVRFLAELEQVRASPAEAPATADRPAVPPSFEQVDLSAQCSRMANRLDEVGDEQGWGGKLRPVSLPAIRYSLLRAHTRRETFRQDVALRRLEAFTRVIDPVWGGVFVAARGGDFSGQPITEKRTVHQAYALEGFAYAAALTGQARWVQAGEDVVRYLADVMQAPDGTFYATQDEAPETWPSDKPGADYYRLDDIARRRHGVPNTDHASYTDKTARVVAALATFYGVTGKVEHRAMAERAADALLGRLAPEGYVSQWARTPEVDGDERLRATNGRSDSRYLTAQVELGLALLTLHDMTSEPRLARAAMQLGDAVASLEAAAGDPDPGGHYASDAPAVTAALGRHKAVLPNVQAARLLTRLHWLSAEPRFAEAADRTLRFLGRPDVVQMRGPHNIASHAMALDERLLGPVTIELVEPLDGPLHRAARGAFAPRRVIRSKPGTDHEAKVCARGRCIESLRTPKALLAALDELTQHQASSVCGVARHAED
jgi:uncharacterized protein